MRNVQEINKSLSSHKIGGMWITSTPVQSLYHPMHRESHFEDVNETLEDFGVTTDIDEWLASRNTVRIAYPKSKLFCLTEKQLLKRLNSLDITPTAFMLFPVCHYKGRVLEAKLHVQSDIKESPDGEYYLHNFSRVTLPVPDTLKKTTSYRIRYAT